VEKQIEDTLLDTLFGKAFRNRQAFTDHAEKIANQLINSGDDLVRDAQNIVEAYGETFAAIDALRKKSFSNGPAASLLESLMGELRKLVPENFVSLYEVQRLPHLVRYVKALAIRARRALDAPEKDRQKAALIKVHADRLKTILAGLTPSTSDEKRDAVEHYFWLIEEYKVSQYAQELKTVGKVSAKRLDRLYEDLLRTA